MWVGRCKNGTIPGEVVKHWNILSVKEVEIQSRRFSRYNWIWPYMILMLTWFWAKDWNWWLLEVCSNLNARWRLIKYSVLSLLYNESIWNVLPCRLNRICNIMTGWIQLWTICQTRVVPQPLQRCNWCDSFPFFQYTAQCLLSPIEASTL